MMYDHMQVSIKNFAISVDNFVGYRLWNATAYPFDGDLALRNSKYPIGHRIYWPIKRKLCGVGPLPRTMSDYFKLLKERNNRLSAWMCWSALQGTAFVEKSWV